MHKTKTTLAKEEVPNVKPLASVEVLSSKTFFCNKIQSQKVIVDVKRLFCLQMKDF
jgi:hypothetical protein